MMNVNKIKISALRYSWLVSRLLTHPRQCSEVRRAIVLYTYRTLQFKQCPVAMEMFAGGTALREG